MKKRFVTGGSIAIALLCGGMVAAQNGPVAGEVEEGSLAGQSMTFVSYGGIYQDGQIKSLQSFVEKSDVELYSDGPTSLAKLQAQVESGNVMWDVVDTGDFLPYVHCGTLFQRLDFSKIDTSSIPEGQVGDCSVPAMNYGVVLTYNKDAYGDNPPDGWEDFFDTENYPGTRAMPGYPEPNGYIIEIALLNAGVQKDDMFPADVDLALDQYREIRDNLILWQTGAESQQIIESGEADMVIAWTGRALAAVKNGANYEPVWNDWIVVMDQLTIPVGVRDPDAAHALINAAIGKEAQETLTEETSYSPIHVDAQPQVDELTSQWLTHTPERLEQGYLQNVPYWVENYESLSEKWAEFIAGY